jgi:hypothetical protein
MQNYLSRWEKRHARDRMVVCSWLMRPMGVHSRDLAVCLVERKLSSRCAGVVVVVLKASLKANGGGKSRFWVMMQESGS